MLTRTSLFPPPGADLCTLLDAVPAAVMFLGEHDEVLYANSAMRAVLEPVNVGDDPVARVRRLAGPYGQSTQYGFCICLPQNTASTPSPTDLQTQRLASLGFMVAGVCHEVSNPLAAIHSMVQILRSGRSVTAETVEKGLDSIASNIARVLAITKKLGDFSRVTGDALEGVEIDAAMQEAIGLLRHSAAGSGVRVKYRGAIGAQALARPGELQQVFFNLLLNAAQAMNGAGMIDAMAQSSPGEPLRVTVTDSGPGIPVPQLRQVFDPFFTTTAPGEGTGLGLAICYEIVHGLGGTIQAGNDPAGGARLQVELPRHGAASR